MIFYEDQEKNCLNVY